MSSRIRTLSSPARALAAAMLLLIPLGGCGSLVPQLAGPPADIYTLTPKSTFDPRLAPVSWQLVVEEPQAAGGLNTARIAMSKGPTQLDYFSRVRWSERAPLMVQTLLVESFENTGKIVAVGREAIGLRSDYNLRTDLREFQAEYYGVDGGVRVRVRLNGKLVKQPKRNIIASRTFEQVVVTPGRNMGEIVTAFDEALGKVLRQTVEWALTTAR